VTYVFIDPDGTNIEWLGVVVRARTGITYWGQCGGNYLRNREVEGFFVPVGGASSVFHTDGSFAPSPRDFAEFFKSRVGIESPDAGPSAWARGALEELEKLVALLPWWRLDQRPGEGPRSGEPHGSRYPLALDRGRLDECIEAWVPVDLRQDGSGVLVFENRLWRRRISQG
jgi:hypothetical protein